MIRWTSAVKSAGCCAVATPPTTISAADTVAYGYRKVFHALSDFVATAALNPDSTVAVVVQNLRDHEIFLRVWREGKSLRFTAPPDATMTFVLQPI